MQQTSSDHQMSCSSLEKCQPSQVLYFREHKYHTQSTRPGDPDPHPHPPANAAAALSVLLYVSPHRGLTKEPYIWLTEIGLSDI